MLRSSCLVSIRLCPRNLGKQHFFREKQAMAVQSLRRRISQVAADALAAVIKLATFGILNRIAM